MVTDPPYGIELDSEWRDREHPWPTNTPCGKYLLYGFATWIRVYYVSSDKQRFAVQDSLRQGPVTRK